MTNIGEIELRSNSVKVISFDKQPQVWDRIESNVLAWNQEEFGIDPEDPLLGETNEIHTYENLRDAFFAPDTRRKLIFKNSPVV